MTELEDKVQTFAKIVEGRSITDDPRFEVFIKGTVMGFPVMLQAIKATWPFGLIYTLETQVIDDPNAPPDPNALLMQLSPRVARGMFAFFAKILLFEPTGQHLSDRRMEQRFMFTYNNALEAERFVRYPGLFENLLRLEHCAKFTELTIRAKAGLVLTQPVNFNSINPDVCRETFKLMSDVGQVLFEAF
jgi:hypothetical protein